MAFRPVRLILVFSALALMVSCGDQGLFMSLKSDTTDMQIKSIADGQVLAGGAAVPLSITAADTGKSRDVEIEVTLTSPSGDSVWHNRSSATVNEQIPITLPSDLPSGMYHLDLVLYSAGEVVQKKSSSFFVAKEGWKITGIKSFPPVITTTASVMLKAELAVPAGADPYLRWSWKGKVLAKGTLASGFGQILWVAPSDQGVYTITLELFPSSPPAGSDFSFTSSLLLSTDIFVTGNRTLASDELGPDASYLSLLHLQATLSDSGSGAQKIGKTQAAAIGTPQVVPLEEGFGYRFDGTSGIQIPWLAVPAEGGVLKPFTISIGVTFEDLGSANTIVAASSADGGFSVSLAINSTTRTPQARLGAGGAPALVVPWSGPPIVQGQRYLLSLSVVPQGGTITGQWFLDGIQVSAASSNAAVSVPRPDGTLTIGGQGGFKGVVDEFGVFFRDAQDRPSPDPGLYVRAMTATHGKDVVLAEGFDGIFLSSGFSLEAGGTLVAGSLVLPPAASLDLPPLKMDGGRINGSAAVSSDSARSATIEMQWEGANQPGTQYQLTNMDTTGIKFRIAADGQSAVFSSPAGEKTLALPRPPQGGTSLLVKIGNPGSAKSALTLTDLLVVQDRK
jgi:hypothetical protein